ncbi:MAG: DNA methyltransferase [Candidatus Peribacteraceae bacterium]
MKRKTGPPASTPKIESIPLDQLHPYPDNPRSWTPEQLEQLKTSIKNNKWLVPVVVNRAKSSYNTILSGHMRVAAAGKLGYKEVPAIFVVVDDKEREREIVIRLNKNVGSWDFERLKSFDVDFLVEVGFDPSELAGFWDDMLETEEDGFDVEKELEAIKEPKVKIGDLYQLGSHRLVVGDSTDPAVVKRLMGNAKAALVDCDPPFSIGLDYDKGVSGKKHYGGKTNDHMSEEQYTDFLRKLIANAKAVASPDAHYLFWCDQNGIWRTQTLYRELGIKHQRLCWWLKGQFMVTPTVAFNKAGEAIVYGITGSPYLAPNVTNLHEIQDKDIGSGSRMIDDVIDSFSIWLCKRVHGSKMEHPTEKDPTIHEKALRRCSRPGDVVLDLCGGSGSLLIACEQMKRRAFLSEIEPVFADLIIRRFESLTGTKATLLKP